MCALSKTTVTDNLAFPFPFPIPSHSGLCIVERGSNSEKRRKRRGLDPFGGFLDFSGIPMDPMSPLHTTIRCEHEGSVNPRA